MTIAIKTQLHDGIAHKHAGKTVVHYTFNKGPLNLLKAAGELVVHRARLEQRFGNIGRGRSWLEIDGIKIDDDVQLLWSKTPMADARHMLANTRQYNYELREADNARA